MGAGAGRFDTKLTVTVPFLRWSMITVGFFFGMVRLLKNDNQKQELKLRLLWDNYPYDLKSGFAMKMAAKKGPGMITPGKLNIRPTQKLLAGTSPNPGNISSSLSTPKNVRDFPPF